MGDMEKYNYLLQYMDMQYHTHYDKERSKIHASIIDKYFLHKIKTKEKSIVIVCGCYGSGKNYIVNLLQKQLLNPNEYIHVDLDEVRQQIPEYTAYMKENPWTVIRKTNREAGYITELIQRHALFNGYNVIMNGSLKDSEWHYSYLTWIKDKFPIYNGIVLHIKATWVVVLERNILRAEEQGRWIPLKILKESMELSDSSFNKIKTHPIIRGSGQIDNTLQNFDPVNENLKLMNHLLFLLGINIE